MSETKPELTPAVRELVGCLNSVGLRGYAQSILVADTDDELEMAVALAYQQLGTLVTAMAHQHEQAKRAWQCADSLVSSYARERGVWEEAAALVRKDVVASLGRAERMEPSRCPR